MKRRNNFLEQLKQRQQAASSGGTASTEKPIEEMTDTELDQALTQARRDLLDAQHQELRERELARVQGHGPERVAGQGRTLSDVLRELQRGKKRTWR